MSVDQDDRLVEGLEDSTDEDGTFEGFPTRRDVLKAAGATGAAAFLSTAVVGADDERFSSGDTITVESTPETVDWGAFDPEHDPVAEVESGDTVVIETVTIPQPNHRQFLLDEGISEDDVLEDEVTIEEEVTQEGPGPHVVTGPVHVNGAEPGDVLEVRVRDVEIRAPYGINIFRPDAGALPEDFPWADTAVIPLDRDEEVARFVDDIEIPLDPFFGIMATGPAPESGRTSTRPPNYFGGNMDVPLLTAGTSLYLPVNAEGGRFYAADGHSAQGNGEVNLTAIETSLTGTFEFVVHEDTPRLEWPVAETDDAYIVVGLNEDLNDAMTHAVREAITLLVHQLDLEPAEAYRLCSIAIDFNVSQVVNGTQGIHGVIPKSLFAAEGEIDPDALESGF